jgi:thioesterase domain-containing protein
MDSDLNRIVPLQTGGGKPSLFCVHAVSGSAYSYSAMARLLGPDQPVYGFEAPGFDNPRTPVPRLPDLAAEYTATLREFQPQGPYRLLGWSLGGVVIFLMAQELLAAGEQVATLVMVDAGLPVVMPLPPEREILRRYIRDMMGLSDQSPPGLDAVFANWPEDVEPGLVFEAVEKAGILPEEMDAELLAYQYGVFRAHLAGFYSVVVSGSYPGPAVHITAQGSVEEDMRWDRLIPNLTTHMLPGTHHSIWTGENLVALSEIVRQTLTRN